MISMPSRNWIILRTSGRNTLALAETLGKQFPVWTPKLVERRRSPRRNARTETPAPMLPTFVFGCSEYIHDFTQIAKATIKACPDFSVFHHLDRIPVIADCELDALRDIEAHETYRASRRRSRKVGALSQGETVNITEGAFAGMSGVVEHSDGRYTMVLFGRMSVNVSTFMLRSQDGRLAA